MPPFVYRERTRHGRFVTYFRRGKGSRTRLPDYGDERFQDAYNAALTQGAPPPDPKRKARAGSLTWLIARYRESSSYLGFSMATRKQRDNIFKHVVESAGHIQAGLVTRAKINSGKEALAATPAQSRNFLDAMRGLFKWAEKAEMVKADPTVGVENPPRPKTTINGGFKIWTEQEVERYEARWPVGTKERVWLHVLLYTGLRRGDAVLLGKQHVRANVATLYTEKSGEIVPVPIRIHPQLAETLAQGPTGDLAFIVGEGRKPLTKETFGNYFKEACMAAGVGKSAHGLRKLGAVRAAHAGATTKELEAMFGWTDSSMPELYTKHAERHLLAGTGADKVVNSHPPHLNSASPHHQKSNGSSNG